MEKIFQTDIFLSWLSPDGSMTFDTTTTGDGRGGSGESDAVAQLVERPYKGPLRSGNLAAVGSIPGSGIRWYEKSYPHQL